MAKHVYRLYTKKEDEVINFIQKKPTLSSPEIYTSTLPDYINRCLYPGQIYQRKSD